MAVHTPAYQAFLLRLRAARKRAGLTQVAVAQRLKKPQAYVSRIETGETRIDAVEATVLAALYDVTLEELLGDSSGGVPPAEPLLDVELRLYGQQEQLTKVLDDLQRRYGQRLRVVMPPRPQLGQASQRARQFLATCTVTPEPPSIA